MRILFITATRIGDAILSTGLLSYLIEQHPDARITVAAGPAAAPLFAPIPQVDSVIVLRKKRMSAHWAGLWRQCIGTRWDIVIDLRRSALSWLLLAGKRHIMPPPGASMHRVEFLAATLGLAKDPPSPACWTAPADDAFAERLIPPGTPVLAIGAAANWPGKQWRAEYFATLVQRLTASDGILPDARIAVFGAPQEREQVQPLLDSIAADRRIDLVGQTELPAAAACLRRCALFIGNDSGLMHMAAASGTPTLGLFGPSHTTHYAPWGPGTAWVRTEKSYDEIIGAPGYNHRTTGTLMDSLTVDMAEAASRKLWAEINIRTTPDGESI